MTDRHEQLSGGVAATGGASDTPTVRLAPLPEGDRTVGQSGKETVWDRDPLREAVESGALDGATIVKGEGGTNPHFPLDEQVPPENILGRVESWSYEEGVGPVGEADVVDEQMARRIDAGLLEVSADLERHLGAYDDDRGAYPVDEIVGMPRVTLLERGASRNATVATAEALGYNPSGDNRFEQLASTHSPTYDGTSASGEWSKPNLGDFDTDDLGEVAQHFLASTSGFDSPDSYDDLKLPVVAPSGTLYLDALESAHQLAGQTDGLTDDDVSAVRTTAERLADEAFGESLTEEQNSDERAEPRAGPTNDPDTTMPENGDDVTKEQLREQLAAAKAEKNQLETEKESLEEQTDTLESEVEEKESELSEKEERIDEMEDELEETRSEAEFSRRQAALIAVGGNEAAAETLVESDRSADDLAEMALDSDHGPEVLPSTDEETDDEQLSPMDKLNEQLASPPAQRGQSPGDGEETGVNGGNLTDEQLAAGEDRALEVMDSSDIRTASEEDLSRREYFKKHKGVDPARVESTEQLRAKLNGDGGDA